MSPRPTFDVRVRNIEVRVRVRVRVRDLGFGVRIRYRYHRTASKVKCSDIAIDYAMAHIMHASSWVILGESIEGSPCYSDMSLGIPM